MGALVRTMAGENVFGPEKIASFCTYEAFKSDMKQILASGGEISLLVARLEWKVPQTASNCRVSNGSIQFSGPATFGSAGASAELPKRVGSLQPQPATATGQEYPFNLEGEKGSQNEKPKSWALW